jgi:hypothetical protein
MVGTHWLESPEKHQMNDTLKQAILTFEDEWRRYSAFTSGLLIRETPLDEADLARLMDVVNQITLAREKLDQTLGINADRRPRIEHYADLALAH